MPAERGCSSRLSGGGGRVGTFPAAVGVVGEEWGRRRRKEAGLYCRYLLPGSPAASSIPSRQTAGGTISLPHHPEPDNADCLAVDEGEEGRRVGLPVAAGSAGFDDDDDDDAPGHRLSFAAPMLGGFGRIWCWCRWILRWCRGIRTVPACAVECIHVRGRVAHMIVPVGGRPSCKRTGIPMDRCCVHCAESLEVVSYKDVSLIDRRICNRRRTSTLPAAAEHCSHSCSPHHLALSALSANSLARSLARPLTHLLSRPLTRSLLACSHLSSLPHSRNSLPHSLTLSFSRSHRRNASQSRTCSFRLCLSSSNHHLVLQLSSSAVPILLAHWPAPCNRAKCRA